MTGFVNPFAGIDKAPNNAGGAYTLKGLHTVRLGECKLIQSAQKGGAPMFVAEYEILESNNPDCVAGSVRSWVVNFQHPSALSNMKGFIAAAYNVDFEQVDEEVSRSIVGPDQPARGTLMKIDAIEVPTRKGGVFTKCRWEYLAGGIGGVAIPA